MAWDSMKVIGWKHKELYNPCKNSPAVKKGEAKNAQVTDFGI